MSSHLSKLTNKLCVIRVSYLFAPDRTVRNQRRFSCLLTPRSILCPDTQRPRISLDYLLRNRYCIPSTAQYVKKSQLCTPGDPDNPSVGASDTLEFDNGTTPRMAITFTCKVCSHRQTNTFTKLAYEKGIVIIKCDGCANKHLIADNLGWFSHVDARNIEELMENKGELVKRGIDAGLVQIPNEIEQQSIKGTEE